VGAPSLRRVRVPRAKEGFGQQNGVSSSVVDKSCKRFQGIINTIMWIAST
jgi:hypothetical protein